MWQLWSYVQRRDTQRAASTTNGGMSKLWYTGDEMLAETKGNNLVCGLILDTAGKVMNSNYVYVVIALEGTKMKECIVLSDADNALAIYHRLQKVWGGEFVATASRKIDDIPQNVREAMRMT